MHMHLKEVWKTNAEKDLRLVHSRAAVPERLRFVSETVLELNAPISEETLKLLKRAQDLICGSESKAVTLDETIRALAEFYVERKDPVRKAERAEIRKKSCVTRHGGNTLPRSSSRFS